MAKYKAHMEKVCKNVCHMHIVSRCLTRIFCILFSSTDSEKAEAWGSKSDRSIDTLGDEDQKDWKSVWICCCILLYVSSMGLLAEYIHQVTILVLNEILNPFSLQYLHQHLPNGTWGELSLFPWAVFLHGLNRFCVDMTILLGCGRKSRIRNRLSVCSLCGTLKGTWNSRLSSTATTVTRSPQTSVCSNDVLPVQTSE